MEIILEMPKIKKSEGRKVVGFLLVSSSWWDIFIFIYTYKQ